MCALLPFVLGLPHPPDRFVTGLPLPKHPEGPSLSSLLNERREPDAWRPVLSACPARRRHSTSPRTHNLGYGSCIPERSPAHLRGVVVARRMTPRESAPGTADTAGVSPGVLFASGIGGRGVAIPHRGVMHPAGVTRAVRPGLADAQPTVRAAVLPPDRGFRRPVIRCRLSRRPAANPVPMLASGGRRVPHRSAAARAARGRRPGSIGPGNGAE